MIQLLLITFAFGFVTASPIGPIGLMCLRKTISNTVSGFFSAIGIACAYSVCIFVVLHGMHSFSDLIVKEKNLLYFAIGLFFIFSGLRGFANAPDYSSLPMSTKGRFMEFGSTFFLVVFNPTTIIMFSLLFALTGLHLRHVTVPDSLKVSLAAFLGAMTFWMIIGKIAGKIRGKIQNSIYARVSKILSIGIIVFGMVLLFC